MRHPWTVVALVLSIHGGAPALAAAAPRDDALAGLASPDPAVRRRAVATLADSGTMQDLPRLVQALRDRDGQVRALAEQAAWQLWSRSGDPETDRLFAEGVTAMSARAMGRAVAVFTRVIERQPEFAEGWNKRATIYYLMGELQKSLADCDEVVKRNPYHWGALSGYGMIYLDLDQPARALQYFEKALAVNPNLTQVEETAEMLRRLLLQRRRNAI
ncbi:MAG: tetratricopeptide repeat protein [Candidatus Rokubacteria bacterium]|nr:tetratricopeptide repeat protein [Candidatus Rokubacteria bacterium]